MIEQRHVGTHDDQRRESGIEALHEAGIGRAYFGRSLDELGQIGTDLKGWIIANLERVREEGAGFDFRGSSPRMTDLVSLTARAMLHCGLSIRVVPLVRLPKLLASDETETLMRTVRHLVIRDFETGHENPLRGYEIATIEAFIEDRIADNRAVSVTRRAAQQTGWWSGFIEDTLDTRNKVVLL